MSNVIEFPGDLVRVSAEKLRTMHNNVNGAREAIMDIARAKPEDGDEALRTDCFLAELWKRGFKVVPLEPGD